MQILLVEDDLKVASEIASAIEDEGLFCDTCATTADALGFLRQTTYGVAILDHYLQAETSIFLASHLRLRHPATKIVTITGSALFASGHGLNQLGTDFLFRKPFRHNDLIETVKYLRSMPGQPRPTHVPVTSAATLQSAAFHSAKRLDTPLPHKA